MTEFPEFFIAGRCWTTREKSRFWASEYSTDGIRMSNFFSGFPMTATDPVNRGVKG